MFFDGAVNQYEDGIGVPLAVKLNIEETNNMAEYEAYVTKMEALRELGVKKAKVFGDSTLVTTYA